jgi:hypothetical protein
VSRTLPNHLARLTTPTYLEQVLDFEDDQALDDDDSFHEPNAWIGGVVPIRYRNRRQPVEVAAWITYSGILVAAAEIEGDAAAVLRGLLIESLAQTAPAHVPAELIVCPSVEAAVKGVMYPSVKFERDNFLHTVVYDLIAIHETPKHLERRAG